MSIPLWGAVIAFLFVLVGICLIQAHEYISLITSMRKLHALFVDRGDGRINPRSHDAEYDYGYTSAYRNAAESLKERLNKHGAKIK